MRQVTTLQRAFSFSAAAILAFTASELHAITILSGPTFTPSSSAALAGTLTLTTDTDARVSVSVDDGYGGWQRYFYNYSSNQSLTLLGFKPARVNAITVTVTDKFRNSYTAPVPVTFTTTPLPSTFPTMTLHTNNTALMEPGYTLFRFANNTTTGSYVTFVDNAGQVVWYSALTTPSDVRQMTNGDLFYPYTSEAGFGEANMLGQVVHQWTAPSGLVVDSHEDLITDHGTILYLTYALTPVANFPSSDMDSNAPLVTTNVAYARVIEMSYTNSTLLNTWNMLSLLQPTRVNYLCYGQGSFYGPVDPEHANAVTEDTNDNSLIVSVRDQDAVVKFTRAGQIKWILGPHNNWGPEFQPYLLTPVGAPFAWNYAQHAAILTSQGTLLMYDDGNYRAEPWDPWLPDQDNYSRAVEYKIDETNMTVTQVWQYANTNEDRLYSGAVGNATQLPQTGNVLVTYGLVSYENGEPVSPYSTNATMSRLKEVTHNANPTVVFDLELFDHTNTSPTYAGYLVYRSRRVPDLYVHPANPVTDLNVTVTNGFAELQFSGDPVRSYSVQTSSDLVNWQDLGAPFADDANGDYSYEDELGDSAAYYRVATQ